jgi:multicomponent Na+:H+ antiporter subunit E
MRVLAVRTALFLGLWLIVAGPDPAGLVVGLGTAVLAAAASRRLLPPGSARPRPAAWVRLLLRFPGQSVAAGVDIGARAFAPALPLRPGFVCHPPRLPAGSARDAFALLASLVPGSLPAGTAADGSLLVHVLDLDRPVAAGLAGDEVRLGAALGLAPHRG